MPFKSELQGVSLFDGAKLGVFFEMAKDLGFFCNFAVKFCFDS